MREMIMLRNDRKIVKLPLYVLIVRLLTSVDWITCNWCTLLVRTIGVFLWGTSVMIPSRIIELKYHFYIVSHH